MIRSEVISPGHALLPCIQWLTKAKALSQYPTDIHHLLLLEATKVKVAGKDENVSHVDDALEKGTRFTDWQTMTWFGTFNFILNKSDQPHS